MTAAQLAEHTELRRGLVAGKPARPAERGPAPVGPWASPPAGTVLAGEPGPALAAAVS